jgi:hypothetical protein
VTTTTYFLLLVLGVLAGVMLARRAGLSPAERWMGALVPVAAVLGFMGVAQETMITLFPGWSEGRLAPVFGLRSGYPLYPEPGGVLTGHIYGPMGAVVYLPATLTSSPTVALLLGSVIATLLTFAPVVWLMVRKDGQTQRRWLIAAFLFCLFTLFGLMNGSLQYSLHAIHADAPALAFGALACCALLGAKLQVGSRQEAVSRGDSTDAERIKTVTGEGDRGSGQDARTSAGAEAGATTTAGTEAGATMTAGAEAGATPHLVFAVTALLASLSVWSKQPLVLLFVSLPLYVLFTQGRRRALVFALHLLVVGLLTSAAMVLCFGPLKSLYFYMFVVPAGHPVLLHSAQDFSRVFFALLKYSAPALLASALLVGLAWWRETREAPGGSRGSIFRLVPDNGWRLFLLAGACNLPLSFLGMAKYGGDRNSGSFAVYFLSIGALLLIKRALTIDIAAPDHQATRHQSCAQFAAAAVLTGLCVTQAIFSYADSRRPVPIWANPTQEAFDLTRAYPKQVFFPWNPLVGMLTDGKYYHFDSAVNDRLLAKWPISMEDFKKHIPEQFQIVAYPPGHWQDSKAALAYLPEFREPTPGPTYWKFFKRPGEPGLVEKNAKR